MRRVQKTQSRMPPSKEVFCKGGFSPFASADFSGKKAKEQCFLGAKKIVFRECPPRWGDTNLLLCNCWFLWCFRNSVFKSFPHENIFRNYLVGPLSTTSLSVSLYLAKCSFTKFYKNNFGCLPSLVCVLIENLTRTSLKSRQGFSSPIMLNTAMSFNMNICSYLDQHENVLIIRIEWTQSGNFYYRNDS